jgi:hypothetical protein
MPARRLVWYAPVANHRAHSFPCQFLRCRDSCVTRARRAIGWVNITPAYRHLTEARVIREHADGLPAPSKSGARDDFPLPHPSSDRLARDVQRGDPGDCPYFVQSARRMVLRRGNAARPRGSQSRTPCRHSGLATNVQRASATSGPEPMAIAESKPQPGDAALATTRPSFPSRDSPS